MEVVELTHLALQGKEKPVGPATCRGLQSLLPAFKFVLHCVITGLRNYSEILVSLCWGACSDVAMGNAACPSG